MATDADIHAAAHKLLTLAGPETTVLVTLGAKGALLLDRAGGSKHAGGGTWLPCPTVDKVVDTSGAGDCFLGALAAYLSAGDADLEAAVTRAGQVASLSVQRPGTQTSYPKASELPPALRL